MNLDWISIAASVNKVPGIIEAEDYDDNGYKFKSGQMGSHKKYRRDQGVAISASKNIIHISNTSNGDWLNYSFDAEAGTYDIKVYAATPKNGRFSLSFDNGNQKSKDFMSKPENGKNMNRL